MKTLWAVIFLLHESLGHEVTEPLDSIPNNATTTLFPVAPDPSPANTTILSHFADKTTHKIINSKLKSEATVWKVETAFAESKLEKTEQENVTETEGDKPQNRSQEFRPSQHLGDFFDVDSVDPITFSKENFQHFTPIAKKPSEGFKGINTSPKKYPDNAQEFPYKFDSHKSPWMRDVEGPPAKGPWGPGAGPFLSLSGEQPEGDFGIDFKGELAFKEQGMKKRPRVDPWRGVMRMLSALLPTALIVSALTPSIINVDHMRQPFPTRLTRRSTPAQPAAPPRPPPPPPPTLQAPISERCRRRLLCELQAEEHYKQSAPKERELSSLCRRHRCADPSILAPLISWLLQPRRRADGEARGNKLY